MKKRVIIEMQFDYNDNVKLVDEIINLQKAYLERVIAASLDSNVLKIRTFLDDNEHDINFPFPSKTDPERRARVVSWISMNPEVSDFGGEEAFFNEIIERFKLKDELEKEGNIMDLEDILETACSKNEDNSCKSGIYMF